jgi:hypothetical protein
MRCQQEQNIVEALERLIGRLYNSFIMRDLSFLISGGLVIGILIIPFKIKDWLISGNSNPWIVVPAYLGIAYVVGLILQEAALLFLRRRDQTEEDNHYLAVLMEDIHQHCHFNTVIAIERILYFKQIGSTFCGSLPVIIVVLLAYRLSGVIDWDWWPQLLIPLIITFLGFLVCISIYFRFSGVETEVIRQLRENINRT